MPLHNDPLDFGLPDLFAVPDWPHQSYALDEVRRLRAAGVNKILVACPTGGGKTKVIAKLVYWAVENGLGVTLLCNRKLLIEQMCRTMSGYGVDHGVRAAGHGLTPAAFQISSVQTEYSRVVKRRTWDVHGADVLIVDEAHLYKNPMAAAVFAEYVDRGAVQIGFTATPLGLDGEYEELVVAGVTSELRACGALVEARHFGCTEPDLVNVRRVPIGEDISEDEDRKLIMVPGIHGRVIDHFRRLNPHGLPSIGFAPGVPESIGFAEAFCEAGIPAAHIDGENLWINGETVTSTEKSRAGLLELSRTGKVRIVWNRFVLREAVDMPWLRHGVLATVFGSLQSYLQSGGRLLRSCPSVGKREVVVQDHGGNWWRHGSLNADRHWKLSDTGRVLSKTREDDISGNNPDGTPKEPEPFVCPACHCVMVVKDLLFDGRVVCGCGKVFDFRTRSRPVIQADGELVFHQGNIFRPRRVERRDDTADKWAQVYWRAKNSKMTFSQAEGLFYHEHGYYPPRDLPLMPLTTAEWYLQVKKLPFRSLRPRPPEPDTEDDS